LRVGERSSDSRGLIDELGIGGKVQYLSGLALAELSLAYAAADVFAFPSFEEGFGLPVLEAMACGIPVVASNAASLPEIIGEGGKMVNPGNPEELKGSIYDVLTDENLRQSLIDDGIKNVENFSWKRTAKETRSVYEEVYNGS
jgi:glycosyltransferase involved in cell wall biosynthesis